MEVAKSQGGIFVSQQKYTIDLIRETRMLVCKPTDTTIDPNRKLGQPELSLHVDKGCYQHLVGKKCFLSFLIGKKRTSIKKHLKDGVTSTHKVYKQSPKKISL